MRTFAVGLFTVVVVVGTAAVDRAGAADDASLISNDIFDPSITVSEAPHPGGLQLRSPGLVVNPIFDASITSDPNAATIMSTINAAIAVYKAQFSDSVTVSIKFQEMSSGLGLSSTYYTNISYTNYLAALSADAAGANDASALATLPSGTYNPVNGNDTMSVKLANLRALGFVANPPAGQPDSTISLKTSICNLDRSSIDPSKYDLMAVVSHEIDEALGLGSVLPSNLTGPVFPEDLFRYDQANNRSFDTSSTSQAFFSIDGATHLARFNQGPGGDFGDWFSTGPHTPQVQDAFATQGATPDLGVELTALDVIGYDFGSPPPTATPTQVGFCGGTNATCTPTPTPEDSGFVPPNKDVAKCEAGVAKNVSKLQSCIGKCHIKAAAAAFKLMTFDEEACETTDPAKSCRAKYDKQQAKLLAKGTCPACLDAAHQATLADQAETDLDSGNGALYCAGGGALGGDDPGFVPPNASALKCEAGVAKNVSKLKNCIGKCHIKAAAAAFDVKTFDEDSCETTDPVKSCRAKYDKQQAKLLAKGTCPACLDAAHQATLADQAETDLDNDNGGIYCAGTAPLSPQAALIHDYELNGTFADSFGGPPIVPSGGTLGPTGYTFASDQGPNLSNALPASNYSIEMGFSIDDTSGFRKLIDFKDRTVDGGLYNLNAALSFYPVVSGPTGAFTASVPVTLLVTRDGSTGKFIAYINRIQQFSFTDSASSAIFTGPNNIAHFLRDDTATSSETPSGLLDFVRIYDAPITP